MDGITDSVDIGLSKLWEMVKYREAWIAAAHGVTKSLNNKSLRLQGWVASGQTINREGVQPHPLADNWIKVLLSTALPTRARPSFSHHQPLPSGSLHSLLASSTRGQTEGARTTIVLQPPEQKSQSQKVN